MNEKHRNQARTHLKELVEVERKELLEELGLERNEPGPERKTTVSKSNGSPHDLKCGTTRARTGASATIAATRQYPHLEPSRSLNFADADASEPLQPSARTNGTTKTPAGSARRHGRAEYMWLRRKLKHQVVLYITRALRETKMSRAELAEKLGVTHGRVNQLLTIRGFGEFERVPLDLIYQVWDITNVPPTFLTRRFPTPQHLEEEPPATH